MINFRFHLVSLVAVFLALGIGVLAGSTVIDQVTVDSLRSQAKRFENQRDSARRLAGQRKDALDVWAQFEKEAPEQLLLGRLKDVPVTLVTVDGVDGDALNPVHQWFDNAEAVDLGTLRLTEKWKLAGQRDTADLAAIVGTTSTRPDQVRQAGLAKLAEAMTPLSFPVTPPTTPPDDTPSTTAPVTLGGAPLLVQLRDAGFLEYDRPEGTELDVADVANPAARIVVVSGPSASVPNEQAAQPLTKALGMRVNASVVAADTGPDKDDKRATFVGPIRSDRDVSQRVSTVDDLDLVPGEVALVLAIEDLASGAVGHYGMTADRLLPEPNASAK